jgi:fission process protein 1
MSSSNAAPSSALLDANVAVIKRRDALSDIDSTDTAARYAAYAARAARVVTKFRHLAYTSDFGEAFRPIAHPALVKLTYAMSIGYVVGDIGWEGYRDYHEEGARGQVLAQHVAKRAVFQGVASLLLPAVTIHTVVHAANNAAKAHVKHPSVRMWGPSLLGLAVVPLLPLYDHPVEAATDFLFEALWPVPLPHAVHADDAAAAAPAAAHSVRRTAAHGKAE